MIYHIAILSCTQTINLGNEMNRLFQIDSSIDYNTRRQYCIINDLIVNENKFYRTKNFGIFVDNNLELKPHILLLCKNVRSETHIIHRIRHITGTERAKNAYLAWFENLFSRDQHFVQTVFNDSLENKSRKMKISIII